MWRAVSAIVVEPATTTWTRRTRMAVLPAGARVWLHSVPAPPTTEIRYWSSTYYRDQVLKLHLLQRLKIYAQSKRCLWTREESPRNGCRMKVAFTQLLVCVYHYDGFTILYVYSATREVCCWGWFQCPHFVNTLSVCLPRVHLVCAAAVADCWLFTDPSSICDQWP